VANAKAKRTVIVTLSFLRGFPRSGDLQQPLCQQRN